MTKFKSLLDDFENILKRFEEILQKEKNDIIRDSAIKRFEMAFDLAWKTTKAFLEERHNIRCISPRNCFREAFRLELLEYSDYWINLVSDRNYTVHAYSEKLAEKIYNDLPKALGFFQELLKSIIKAKNER